MNNKRYEKLTGMIKQWYKDKSQDELILKSLYNQVALQENSLVDRTQDLKGGTKYSNLSERDFVKLFSTNNFMPLEKDDIKHLFQELHNRYMKGNNFEVTRNVAVVDDKNQSAYGYVCYSDDLLYINKHAIDKAKTIDPKTTNFNKTNLGISLMFIIMHESQHVTQYETAIDFALNEPQEKDKAFLGAMGIIKNTNFSISDKKHDDFVWKWRNNYDFRYVEHNANFSAFEKAMATLPEEEKKGRPFDQYNAFTTQLSLRSRSYDKEFIKNRVLKMEDVAKQEIEYFAEGTQDCALKQKVMQTVKEYMAVDEHGNSPFRENLTREINEMAKVSRLARENLEKQENQNAVTM